MAACSVFGDDVAGQAEILSVAGTRRGAVQREPLPPPLPLWRHDLQRAGGAFVGGRGDGGAGLGGGDGAGR
jgi:hypothetical protein